MLRTNYNNFTSALDAFAAAAAKLSAEWDEVNNGEVGCVEYPFDYSFDDITLHIQQWKSAHHDWLVNANKPFSGTYTVYNAGEDVPQAIAEQIEDQDKFDSVLVCDRTQAFILYMKGEYYTIACNEDVLGSLQDCIDFLTKKILN